MRPKVHLLDGRVTAWQQALLAVWSLALVSVVALWAPRGIDSLVSGPSGLFLSIGQLLGLLATFFALTQFMLMGRVFWIEQAFGLDRLAGYHRLNGYMAITLILLHPMFITLYHVTAESADFVAAYLSIFQEYPYTVWALVAELLFVAVVLSSIYISRKRLKFETWYYVHLMVYLAIALVPFHQFVNGSTFAGSTAATWYWIGLYAFVALNLLIWRFGLVFYRSFKYDFTISRVVRETPTTTSLYIKARGLQRLRVRPGQFILLRILTRKLWWQEHPFTVSWIPHEDELRVTVRKVGDFTADIAELKPGTKVAVSGPFGRFTSRVAVTPKRLFIAGGIGITPLRCLAEEAGRDGTDAVLLYANRTPDDVPLKSELDALGGDVRYIYSDATVKGALKGMFNGDRIKELVPDFASRDVYICGPPAMMASIVNDLRSFGVADEQIHYERFALHNR